MILGIVGSEAAKFTPETEAKVRMAIRGAIKAYGATKVVSGRCPKGGVDIYSIEEAKALGIETQEFPPTVFQWSGPSGYMARNKQIAESSDMVICFTLKSYDQMPNYNDMRFKSCYHCRTDKHVKSGGCWTAKYARQIGKAGITIVVK